MKKVIEIVAFDKPPIQMLVDYNETPLSIAYKVHAQDYKRVYLNGRHLTAYAGRHYTLEELGAKPMDVLRFVDYWGWIGEELRDAINKSFK